MRLHEELNILSSKYIEENNLKGIVLTGANSTLTIGNNQNALDRTTPIITGTNGYSVEMTGATSTFNFYDGKLVGGTKALASEEKRTFYGR